MILLIKVLNELLARNTYALDDSWHLLSALLQLLIPILFDFTLNYKLLMVKLAVFRAIRLHLLETLVDICELHS